MNLPTSVKVLAKELRVKIYHFDPQKMNGVTYKDCQIIACYRGYDLESGESSGFPSAAKELYYYHDQNQNCLILVDFLGCKVGKCRRAKKDEAFLIYNAGYWVCNEEYIKGLK